MADKTTIPAVDADEVERLARQARAGDPTGTPPVYPSEDAGEIGRRMVLALDHKHRDEKGDDVSRSAAYSNLRGLAVAGGAAIARRIIKHEAPFKITRNGKLTTIARVFSVPSHLITDGQKVEPSEPNGQGASAGTVAFSARQYIQLDFATWDLLRWLRDHLTARRDGLGISVTLLDEILALEAVYPGCAPREAMVKAGLDPTTLQIDLDKALASLAEDPDVGAQDSTG